MVSCPFRAHSRCATCDRHTPRSVALIDRLAYIDFTKAISLVCLLLEDLRRSGAPVRTAEEIPKESEPDARLDNHILLLITSIRPNIILNAFRQLALRDPKIITVFIDKLSRAGYDGQAERMRQILGLDSRLAAIPDIQDIALPPSPVEPYEFDELDFSS